MKIEPRQVEAFLKKPNPVVRGVVVYGNDDGLVAERATLLAKTVCADLKDPFRVVDIAGDALKADPARLADEFSAMSLMGGRRVIRVRPAAEESVTALHNLVEAGAGDALIVLEAGNLTPRSQLRTLAETEACLAALPCYMDTTEALEVGQQLPIQGLGEFRLQIDRPNRGREEFLNVRACEHGRALHLHPPAPLAGNRVL